MTEPVDHVEALASSLDQLHTTIAGVGSDQLNDTTPCRSWDVTDLVDHVMNDVVQFTNQAEGGRLDPTATADPVPPEEWAETFASRSAALMDAWRAASSTPSIEMQISEITLHTWDLAKATQQEVALDPMLAEVALASMTAMLEDAYRGSEEDGKMFGPQVDAPEDADAYERLAAFAGRAV